MAQWLHNILPHTHTHAHAYVHKFTSKGDAAAIKRLRRFHKKFNWDWHSRKKTRIFQFIFLRTISWMIEDFVCQNVSIVSTYHPMIDRVCVGLGVGILGCYYYWRIKIWSQRLLYWHKPDNPNRDTHNWLHFLNLPVFVAQMVWPLSRNRAIKYSSSFILRGLNYNVRRNCAT